jgi:hypothetical protein
VSAQLDATGGFYLYRWGDACVHMLAVAALLPRRAVLRLRTVPYWHQGTVLLPAELAAAATILLGELPPPVFSLASPQEELRLHARVVAEAEHRNACDREDEARAALSPAEEAAAAAAQRAADEAELEELLA